ncbi:hypothetical protein [Streptomyces sp. NPDC002913]
MSCWAVCSATVPICGFGYEHRRRPTRHPNCHDLVRVSDDREVHVMNASVSG